MEIKPKENENKGSAWELGKQEQQMGLKLKDTRK